MVHAMQSALIAIILSLLAFARASPDGASVVKQPHHKGNVKFKQAGRWHTLVYDFVQAVSDDSIIELNHTAGFVSMRCDLDGSALELSMSTSKAAGDLADALSTRIQQHLDTFVVGKKESGCPVELAALDTQRMILLRRVLSVHVSGSVLSLGTAIAQYGDVIQEGNISYSSKASDPDDPMHACLGLNVADPQSCNTAKSIVPLFSQGGVTVTCDNCFAGFHTDIFFDLHFKPFGIRSFQGGFKNMVIDAALDLDLQVSMDHTFIALDKDLFHAGGEDHPVIHFNIGLIPFMLWFEADAHVTAGLSCSGKAETKFGVTMHHNIGDNYVTWDSEKKWQHIKSENLSTSFQPTTYSSADVHCDGTIAMTPSVALHANQIFSASTAMHPSVAATVDASSATRQVCETGQYSIDFVAQANMHADILGKWVSLDANWGPETFFQAQGELPKVCAPLQNAAIDVIV